jgi:hypothetical protein
LPVGHYIQKIEQFLIMIHFLGNSSSNTILAFSTAQDFRFMILGNCYLTTVRREAAELVFCRAHV